MNSLIEFVIKNRQSLTTLDQNISDTALSDMLWSRSEKDLLKLYNEIIRRKSEYRPAVQVPESA